MFLRRNFLLICKDRTLDGMEKGSRHTIVNKGPSRHPFTSVTPEYDVLREIIKNLRRTCVREDDDRPSPLDDILLGG